MSLPIYLTRYIQEYFAYYSSITSIQYLDGSVYISFSLVLFARFSLLSASQILVFPNTTCLCCFLFSSSILSPSNVIHTHDFCWLLVQISSGSLPKVQNYIYQTKTQPLLQREKQHRIYSLKDLLAFQS